MFCPKCGKQVDDNATYCSSCGQALNQPAEQESNVSKLAKTELVAVDKNAKNGFILGLVSIIAWLFPLLGYPVTICGIVFSVKGLKSYSKKTMAIIGLVLSIIFLLVTFINSLLGVLMQLEAIQ